MELLVLFFDQVHRFAVGDSPERRTNYWPTEVPKTYVERWSMNCLERCRRVHVPVIPTVASPKNIMGSRPYNLLDSMEMVRGVK